VESNDESVGEIFLKIKSAVGNITGTSILAPLLTYSAKGLISFVLPCFNGHRWQALPT